MSLKSARMMTLSDQLDAEEEALRVASEKEKEEEKIKASKKPAKNK